MLGWNTNQLSTKAPKAPKAGPNAMHGICGGRHWDLDAVKLCADEPKNRVFFCKGVGAFTMIYRALHVPWLNSPLPSGNRLHNYLKSQFSMGKSTINGHFP